MLVKLLTEHYLEFLRLKGGCKAHLSLHLSKRHIVGNHMPRLIVCLIYAECSGSVGRVLNWESKGC